MTAKSDLKKRIRARQAKTGESYTTARAHVLAARDRAGDDAQRGPERVTAAVLKCGETSLRLRLPGEDGTLTLRCSSYDAWVVAPGQWVEATISKRWTWRDDAYASGSIERAWTDVPALGLEPLALEDQGLCDLREVFDPFEPPDPYAPVWDLLTCVPRREYELDGIAWGAGVGVDPDDHEACLVADASELIEDRGRSAYPAARRLLNDTLLADLRCIDAHVHLGNLDFDAFPDQADVHYRIAIAIGELSLEPGFDGLLPWHCLYNRPFLRALHGHGLCLWRLGQPNEARRVFERMFGLNPPDNQGGRFCWEAIRRGHAWSSDEPRVEADDGLRG